MRLRSFVLLLPFAIVLSTACSSDPNDGAGPNCANNCPGQPAKSQAQLDACNSDKTGPCGSSYKDLLQCQQGCGNDVATRCAGAFDAWKRCTDANRPKDAGAGG